LDLKVEGSRMKKEQRTLVKKGGNNCREKGIYELKKKDDRGGRGIHGAMSLQLSKNFARTYFSYKSRGPGFGGTVGRGLKRKGGEMKNGITATDIWRIAKGTCGPRDQHAKTHQVLENPVVN